ncbi:aspartate/glutamate racemase family protein [Ralstonia flatus]|uniref:Hydantoin racemase n=1 Tax=Ralstonia flatus TaxID=3058601 RepID=A0AAD2C562_9RALS|nr:aspartate/glutamate racemase family protein [Ralstonia sp. LMG 32965]MBN6208341.1 Asp/Glu racemase [Ralstonia pickettii]CAJ0893392.1 Hydantoin racemase [Ralstonia sp. LMG 32965]CAJ0903312.1 Hydantoin racemase [Ralstonia sp. LMG 32965]
MTIATESSRPRRLLLINPNTTSALTQTITRFVQAALPGDVVVESVTARFGAPYIATEVGYAVAAHAALDAWTRAEQPAIDAAIIGCFGDPGLFALREVAPCPVTGLAEAALMEAATYGSCAVITGGHAWGPILERLLPTLEGGHTVRDIHTVELDGAALYAEPDAAEQILIGACTTVLRRQPVDAIVLGGAGLAGLAQKLQAHVPVPLIDSVTAAARQVWHAQRGGHGALPAWMAPATHA